MDKKKYESQKVFWEQAGEVGYDRAMFSDRELEDHIMTKHRKAAIALAEMLGLGKNSNVLELGCGDGRFADGYLAVNFAKATSFDISQNAIDRAKAQAKHDNVTYIVRDAVNHEYDDNESWDGAFMLGFLHHVKPFADSVIKHLSKVTSKVVVVEPNGNNILRKTLELTPTYKKAGEDSYRLKELTNLFQTHGYRLMSVKKLTFLPPFLPKSLFKIFKPLESFIEKTPGLNNLCSTYVIGFEK